MSAPGCKVCRLLAAYDLQQYESQLVAQWTAGGSQRKGYRALAAWLNTTLLRREMDRAGLSTLGDEATSKYERLTGDDDAVSAEIHAVLEAEGVPIDRLERDFVSYGVVRTHLKECLGVERDHEPTDWEARSIEIARERAREKIAEAVRSLERKGDLAAEGEIVVHLDAEVECQQTHARVPIDRALRRGYVSRPEP